MIEERGRVLSVENDAVWVETIHQSACGSCQARAGCGQTMLKRLGGGARQGFIRALDDHACRVGDEVIVGIAENAVVRGSMLVYAVPLFSLFALALLADAFGMGEPATIVAGFIGMFGGFRAVRWYTARSHGDPDFQPRILGHAGARAESGKVSAIHQRS